VAWQKEVRVDKNRVWAVDSYVEQLFIGEDDVLASTLGAMAEAGLPPINVAPIQGRLLQVLAMLVGARRILEIGTLGGYSTIWLARALPTDGQLLSLEAEPRHAAVARANLARAGLAERVEVREGQAQQTLRELAQAGTPPFDLVFIDADKEGYPAYLELSLQLTRPGSLIVADNVVRDGDVANPHSSVATTQAVQRFNEALAAEPRVAATILPMLSRKGYDGLALAVVRA
jgi:predicted O-methyltransferase YrrM